MKTNIIPQKPLYRTVLKRVADACNGDEILFMFRYNLTRNNTFLYGCAAICGKTLYSGTENGTISKIEIAKMSDIQYIQYVGCAAIEYTFNGELFELCRSDMKNAIALQSATKRLIAISEGRKFEKSDEEETCCPICGTPYRQGSKTCTLCTDKKKLMFRLYPFAKPHSSKLLIAIILFLAISAINVLTPFLNKILINKYIDAENPSTDGFVLLIAAIAFAALAIAIMQMIRSIILVKVGNKIIVSLREVVYRKVQELSLAGVNKRTVGEIYQRVTQDTNVLKEFLTETLPDVVQMSLVYIAIMTVMLVINWKLTLIVLIPVPLVMLMFYSLRGFMHRLYHRQWQAESDVNTLLNDVFSGIRVVKVFGTEEIENKRFNKSARKVADLSAKNERTWNMIMPFANFLIGIGEYAVLLFAGTQVLNGEMKLGDLSQLLAYVGMLYGPIRYAAFLPRRLTRCMTSLAKVFEIIDEEPEIVDGKNLLDETLNGNLSFKNASFGYNNYENVLKNITLDINKGEMVGIVGRSGVGKSTL
ncbi:MAG: ABC transporter transmembrane domain-containing protein, partial [Clostridia bacterium]